MVGLFSPEHHTYAQSPGVSQCYTSAGDAIPLSVIGSPAQCISPNSWHGFTPAPNPDAPFVGPVQPTTDDSCSIWSAGTWGDCISGYILAPLAQLVFQLISLLLWLAGSLLNYIVDTTIVNMAVHINGGVGSDGITVVGMSGINIAWKVLRDLMNIAFIFLLVYEGIKMIIGLSDVAKVRKFIVGIVLASLLINFSLFFTKVIIDASNIVTIGVYKSILNDTNSSGTTGGLSNAYQQSLGTQGLFGPDYLPGTTGYGKLTISLMSSVLILITAFVFFAISVLLVVRYIVLILLLILSPIAYMGMALPGMKKHADKWWESLWGQILFAPVYMLMTWVILILVNSDGFTGITTTLDKTQWAAFVNSNGAAGPSSSSIGLFFNFAVIIGLTVASLVIAKGFATQGAGQIKDLTGKATAFAGGALLGGAGRIGRGTIGRAGNALAGSEGIKDAASKGGVGGFIARTALRTGNQAATSTFDARSTSTFGTIAKSAGMGADFGKGAVAKNVNFQKDLETKAKKEVEVAKLFKPSGDTTEKMKAEGKTDKEIKEVYEKRVDTYADTFKNESAASKYGRYAANFIKVGTGIKVGLSAGAGATAGAAGGSAFVTTAADKREIARQIRRGAKEKSKKEKAYDDLIQAAKEEDEEKKAGEEGGTPTPEPVTPATPTNPTEAAT